MHVCVHIFIEGWLYEILNEFATMHNTWIYADKSRKSTKWACINDRNLLRQQLLSAQDWAAIMHIMTDLNPASKTVFSICKYISISGLIFCRKY